MSDLASGPSATKEDKDPRGGLSAKGHKKFGTQQGVTNYSGASRKDKGRWVSWAMRFTGTPKPVKDDKGEPTRYALMFRAWGEKVPTSVDDVKAVHAKAVKRSQELKNADKASDMASEESTDCSDCERSFSLFPLLLDHVSRVHLHPADTAAGPKIPADSTLWSKIKAEAKAKFDAFPSANAAAWMTQEYKKRGGTYKKITDKSEEAAMASLQEKLAKLSDVAHDGGIECVDDACSRKFLSVRKMVDHAEAVHTFDDTRQMVSGAISDKYGRDGDYRATPSVPGVWTYVADIADDWVVFSVSSDGDRDLYKCSYTVLDGVVTLGAPKQVMRRTVYDEVPNGDTPTAYDQES